MIGNVLTQFEFPSSVSCRKVDDGQSVIVFVVLVVHEKLTGISCFDANLEIQKKNILQQAQSISVPYFSNQEIIKPDCPGEDQRHKL